MATALTSELGITCRTGGAPLASLGLFESPESGRDPRGFQPDAEARPAIHGAPVLLGREAVAKWWSQVADLDGDLEVRPLNFEAHGDCVIVRGYLRQRSGRALAESQVFWLCEICAGQITRME